MSAKTYDQKLRKRRVIGDNKTKIQNAARKIFEHRAAKKIEEVEIAQLQTRLLELMGEQKSHSTTLEDGTPVKVTVVHATSVSVDEDGLKKAIGAKMWDKVTSSHLDMKKLQAFIASGEIDPAVVASVSKEISKAPYVTVK